MSARDALVARLEELAGRAEALTDGCGGPFEWYPEGHLTDLLALDEQEQAPLDAAFVVAHSPALMGPVWRALLAEVEQHRRAYERSARHGAHGSWLLCPECRHAPFDADAGCPFVLRWAAVLGVGEPGASS